MTTTIDIHDIEFDERYENNEFNTVTFYFIAPKEYLNKLHPLGTTIPNTVSAEISIECPMDHIEANFASVMIATTVSNEDDGMEDTNWCDIDLPYSIIEDMILLAENNAR